MSISDTIGVCCLMIVLLIGFYINGCLETGREIFPSLRYKKRISELEKRVEKLEGEIKSETVKETYKRTKDCSISGKSKLR